MADPAEKLNHLNRVRTSVGVARGYHPVLDAGVLAMAERSTSWNASLRSSGKRAMRFSWFRAVLRSVFARAAQLRGRYVRRCSPWFSSVHGMRDNGDDGRISCPSV